MTEEIKQFVHVCDTCQRVNDKFHKPTAVLHPIPVMPEVWNQVYNISLCCSYLLLIVIF